MSGQSMLRGSMDTCLFGCWTSIGRHDGDATRMARGLRIVAGERWLAWSTPWLPGRTGWTVKHALQFLKEKYESGKGSMSPRSFSDYLGKGKGAGLAEVLAEADAYQS